jgi:hypothetical protein
MFLTPEVWAFRTNRLKEAYDMWNDSALQGTINLEEKYLLNTIFLAIKYKILEVYARQTFTEEAFFELTDLILALQKMFQVLISKLNYN